jgi:phenylacetic acid degradation operon negative regulatory protein
MKLTARKLILDLLLATGGEPLSARDFIGACALFDISENNARVALVRLSADGLIEAAERGSYRLSGSAHRLADEVSAWRRAEARLRPWQGGYLAVHCGALSRSDRTRLRRRNRALQMLGFRELERGLFLRPDNIDDGADAVRHRLHALGLEKEAAVFVAQDFDAGREARIRGLWDGKALNASYRQLRSRLEGWMKRADRLETEVAARESYLLGGGAIREVVYDPLLPDPFVDTAARHEFFEIAGRFDRFGKAIWRRLHTTGARPEPGLKLAAALH